MVFTLPENLYATDPNFTTLFRLLDDFDSYSREVQSEDRDQGPPPRHGRYGRGLYPRFDIRETKEAYELYGELPGINRKDVHIELSDTNQLLIRGHAERGYDSPKKPPAAGKSKEDAKTQDGKDNEKEKEPEKNEDDGSTTIRFLQKERQVGNFAREFAFPGPLSEFDISASLENGILKVVAPKSKPSTGRRIEIS